LAPPSPLRRPRACPAWAKDAFAGAALPTPEFPPSSFSASSLCRPAAPPSLHTFLPFQTFRTFRSSACRTRRTPAESPGLLGRGRHHLFTAFLQNVKCVGVTPGIGCEMCRCDPRHRLLRPARIIYRLTMWPWLPELPILRAMLVCQNGRVFY
jgi:hypothetical protein